LVGGLGNQLFGFFAGAYLAEKKQVPVVYQMARKKKGETNHASSLASLDLGSDIAMGNPTSYTLSVVFRKVIRRLVRAIGFNPSTSEKLAKLHTSQSLGLDPCLIQCGPGFVIQGYFQTHQYFDSVSKNKARGVRLRQESDWYKETWQKMKAERPVVIHVRRGDYTLEKNSDIGALSPGYFERVIEEIQSTRPGDNIRFWIFSDNIESVREELTFLDQNQTTWVTPPHDSDAAESMMLMSMARTLVISNSTYSWWAAAISSEAEIIAPSKWFRKLEDPEGLIPANWKTVDSQWIE
jgi:hypothetical protein